MMQVLAQFWRSLKLPEARGPEGAPSPIRPPAAHLPLSKLLQELPEVIVEVFLVMEVLAQLWRSLNLPEARGPEGAPSPIRPPAARRPLSLELPCSSLLSPCSPLALPLLSACYPPLLSLCPLFALPMLAQALQSFSYVKLLRHVWKL